MVTLLKCERFVHIQNLQSNVKVLTNLTYLLTNPEADSKGTRLNNVEVK